MSQENLELVVRALTAACARPNPDFETINEVYDPGHVFVPLTAEMGIMDIAPGAEGYRAWRAEMHEALNAEYDFNGAVDVGADKVIAVTRTRFRAQTSGVTGQQRIWLLVTVRGGKLTRTEAYSDPQAALAAAGS